MRRRLLSRNEDTTSGGYDIGEECCRDGPWLSEELIDSDDLQLVQNERSLGRIEGYQESIVFFIAPFFLVEFPRLMTAESHSYNLITNISSMSKASPTAELPSKARNRYSSPILKYNVFWIGWAFLSYISSTRAMSLIGGDTKLAHGVTWAFVILLVLVSGLFSGLTLGLMSLDKIGLEIIVKSDNVELSGYARRIAPLRKDGNLLLCTLLLGNVAANALLSIVLASQTSELVGFAISTGVITVFGEILPQAVCSRHALMIGSKVVPLVRVFIVLFYLIAKPMAFLLDMLLGEEVGTIHNRTELGELVLVHVKHGALDIETGREMHSALNYKEVMIPAKRIFTLNAEDKLNFQNVSDIFKAGFSRIPVYDKGRNDIVGILFAKDLVFADLEDEASVSSFTEIFNRKYSVVWPDQKLGEVLHIFKQGRSHIGIVYDVNNIGTCDPFYEVVGILTLEDIIEELIGEIEDETDSHSLPSTGHSQMIDMGRLALLNGSSLETALSEEEAKAVASHFVTNVAQFKNTDLEVVLKAVQVSPVLDIPRSAELDSEPNEGDILYITGEVATHCTLILTGRMDVRAGKDGFKSNAGPWSVLSADALFSSPGSYIADFTSSIASDHVRVLRISQATFSAAMAQRQIEEESL